MNQISDRLKGLVQSDIRRMSRECERVSGINLGQGICDLPTIPELVEGACDAIAGSKATYSKFEGIDLLRERIAGKMERFNNLRFDPMKEIVVTVGATGGFATAAMSTLNAGDEVILFEPYYGYHLNTLKILGIVPRFVSLRAPDWSIDFAALRAAFGPKTRGIVVCTPSNPCGKVFTREELTEIGALCQEFDALAPAVGALESALADGSGLSEALGRARDAPSRAFVHTATGGETAEQVRLRADRRHRHSRLRRRARGGRKSGRGKNCSGKGGDCEICGVRGKVSQAEGGNRANGVD